MSISERLKSVMNKIKERVKRVFNLTPKIEEAPDKVYAPKANDDTHGDYEQIDSFLQDLEDEKEVNEVVEEMDKLVKDLEEDSISYESIGKERSDKVGANLSKIGAKFGWTHSSNPIVTGKIKGEDFVCVERTNTSGYGRTICTENAVYDYNGSMYKEYLSNADGTKESLDVVDANSKNVRCGSTKEKDGISLRESAGFYSVFDSCFQSFAEPSEDLLEDYAKATGLPVVSAKEQSEQLRANGVELRYLSSSHMTPYEDRPYVVSIEAEKANLNLTEKKKKCIKYLYPSRESYLRGEKPEMVYVEGVDGRQYESGMFRLQGDSYIDNSTVRRENGEIKYDKVTLEEIQGLMGKVPTELSPRLKKIATGNFELPTIAQKVLDKVKEVEAEREAEKKNKEVHTSKDKKKEDDDGDYDPE